MRLKGFLGAALALAALAAWWFGWRGGQHWLAVRTGTDTGCYAVPAQYRAVCEAYGYWSGFGSVFPWVFLSMGGILTFAVVHWRSVNCHEKGCPWIGRFHLAGGEYKVCGKHHRGFDGKHPTLDHMWDKHLAWKAAHHAPPGERPGPGLGRITSMNEPQTPPPTELEEAPPGVPSHAAAGSRTAARGAVSMAIRQAWATRESTYEGIRQEMLAADQAYEGAVGAAWAAYDEELARIGQPE